MYEWVSDHLAPASLTTEILQECLLTFNQLTTSITVLALNASRTPEQSPRVRMLLEDLLADIQDCERDLGTYADCWHTRFTMD